MTNITVKQGRVTDLTVTIQNDRTNLRGAIEQAKQVRKWLQERGFQNDGHPDFVVVRRNGTQWPAPITAFEQASATFLDPSIKLEEMGLFGMKKGAVVVGVKLDNTRRARTRHDKASDNESNAGEEKSYMLVLSIGDTRNAYKPAS